GRDRFTDDELEMARRGECQHQTSYGMAFADPYCRKPIVPCSIYCAEHIGYDDTADWGDLGISLDEDDDPDDVDEVEAPRLETAPSPDHAASVNEVPGERSDNDT